jgi:hypothetical protein
MLTAILAVVRSITFIAAVASGTPVASLAVVAMMAVFVLVAHHAGVETAAQVAQRA